MKQKYGYKGNYGLELIIDLKDCDLKDLSKKKLKVFFVKLANKIEMKRHGQPIYWEDNSNIPHLRGISAIQFIKTSNFVCHPLPILKSVYINIFSCKEFNIQDALNFCLKYWKAKSENHSLVIRK